MLLDELRVTYPQVIFDLRYGNNIIILDRIIIPKEYRNMGIGTKFMNALIALAALNKSIIMLTPSDNFGATSTNRLKRFYKSFGFIENRGKRKDFTLPLYGMYKKF